MPLYEDDKTALFIDGANLYATTRGLGMQLDFSAMLEYFEERTRLVHSFYFSALSDSEEYNPVKPLTDYLSYHGYNVVTKTAREFTDTRGQRRIKGNMDIEMTVRMLELAPRLDHMILFTGDGDFRCAVDAVQRMGVKVSVVSSMKTNPPILSDELRRQCNDFIELESIADNFLRREKSGESGSDMPDFVSGDR